MPVATVTVTSPSGSSVVSAWVGTEWVAVVVLAVIVTVFEPSSPDATKSLPEASATVRFTVRLALGAELAVTVNCAAVPSVTGDVPAAIVIVGPGGASSSFTVTMAELVEPTV